MLVLTLLALTATSRAPVWMLEQVDEQELLFEEGKPSRMRSEAVITYQTPKGVWPLSIRTDPWRLPKHATYELSDLTHDNNVRPRSAGATSFPGAVEIDCREKRCTGMITMDVSVQLHPIVESGDAEPFDAGREVHGDAGAVDPHRVIFSLSAGFRGSEDDGFFGCDRNDRSTETDEAPDDLGVEVLLEPFSYDPDAPLLPATTGRADASVDAAMVEADAGFAGMDAAP